MRKQLVYETVGFSIRNSEKLKTLSFFTVFVSALIIIGYPLSTSVEGLYSQQIPIYFLAFVFIFLVSLLGEYAAVWLHNEKLVHICLCACNVMVIGLALYELFVFFSFGHNSLIGGERPFSISTMIAHWLS